MIKKVLIFGFNEYSKEIAYHFKAEKTPMQIFVFEEASLHAAKEAGYEAEMAELNDDWLEIGKSHNIDEIICFCALDDDAQNVFLTISLRAEYADLTIISLATSKDSADKLHLAGANKAIAKLETTANVIVESLEKPAVVEVMNDILYRNRDLKLAEYPISEGSILEGAYLHEITLHKEYNIIILAIADKELDAEFMFTTQGHNHKIDADDVLVVMGRESDLEAFEQVIMETGKSQGI